MSKSKLLETLAFPILFQSYKIELALNLTKWTIKKIKEKKKT